MAHLIDTRLKLEAAMKEWPWLAGALRGAFDDDGIPVIISVLRDAGQLPVIHGDSLDDFSQANVAQRIVVLWDGGSLVDKRGTSAIDLVADAFAHGATAPFAVYREVKNLWQGGDPRHEFYVVKNAPVIPAYEFKEES